MPETLQKITMDETDTQHGKFLAFELGKEAFGIEIRYVTEIVGIQKIIVRGCCGDTARCWLDWHSNRGVCVSKCRGNL